MGPRVGPVAGSLAASLVLLALAPGGTAPAQAAPRTSYDASASAPTAAGKKATAVGYGGAVTSVDKTATKVGLKVLKRGGNAVDAAVATAAALGVTEPFGAGIGGGGYFVYYDAASGKVRTIDGRETAPKKMQRDAFIDPATGKPYPFTPDLVTSGVSVGVPGTPATWETALAKWGTWTLADTLAPAADVARDGFPVDDTFHLQVTENAERFGAFTSSRRLYLPKGEAPAVGSTFTNKALARTYDRLAAKGTAWLYDGALAKEIVKAVRKPPTTASTTLPVPPGSMSAKDLRKYAALVQKPTRSTYRGYQVFGMAPSSSGGSTVGETLNILGRYDLAGMSEADRLHHYLDATALAFADRAKYVGDAAYVDVPLTQLLSPTYAAERACAISATAALKTPTTAGDTASYDGQCASAAAQGEEAEDTENLSTTNLTTADRWGNVVEYTLTIEQTGGSGIVVPKRGFLLNNELTDFSTVYDAADPNRIQPGKRPRSSMSPTIVLKHGKPWLALGSPGGSTIITTVLQVLLNRIDGGLSLPAAVAAPRASQRNTAAVTAEQGFIDALGPVLTPYGYTFAPAGDPGSSAAEIGSVTAIEFGPKGRLTVAAEPVRRGGGHAAVVSKTRR